MSDAPDHALEGRWIAGSSRRIWLARVGRYLVALPVLGLMTKALLSDPGRIGEQTGASGMPMPAFVVIATGITALLVGVWGLSEFRFRTPVLLFQIAVVWIGGLLYQQGVRQEISGWDVAEDAVLLGTTLTQVIPYHRFAPTNNEPGRAGTAVRNPAQHDSGSATVDWTGSRDRFVGKCSERVSTRLAGCDRHPDAGPARQRVCVHQGGRHRCQGEEAPQPVGPSRQPPGLLAPVRDLRCPPLSLYSGITGCSVAWRCGRR